MEAAQTYSKRAQSDLNMKKLFLLLLLFSIKGMWAQQNGLAGIIADTFEACKKTRVNKQELPKAILLVCGDVPLYSGASSVGCDDKVIKTIHQACGSDTVYSLAIAEQSPLRFKVECWPYWDVSGEVCDSGWIDKKNVGLYVQDHEGGVMKLYERPDVSSKYMEFRTDDVFTAEYGSETIQYGEFMLLEVGFGPWRKVMFNSHGKTYTGWINRSYSDDVNGAGG